MSVTLNGRVLDGVVVGHQSIYIHCVVVLHLLFLQILVVDHFRGLVIWILNAASLMESIFTLILIDFIHLLVTVEIHLLIFHLGFWIRDFILGLKELDNVRRHEFVDFFIIAPTNDC